MNNEQERERLRDILEQVDEEARISEGKGEKTYLPHMSINTAIDTILREYIHKDRVGLNEKKIEIIMYRILEELNHPTNSIALFGYRMTKLDIAIFYIKEFAHAIATTPGIVK